MIMRVIIKITLTLAVLAVAAGFVMPLFDCKQFTPEWFVMAAGVCVMCSILAMIIKEIWEY